MPLSEATYEELRRAADEVNRQNQLKLEREQSEVQRRRKEVEALVCPTPGCRGFYGADPEVLDSMEGEWTGLRGLNGEVQPAERARMRTDCRVCFEHGRGRVPMNRIRIAVDPGEPKEPEPRPTTGRFAA